MTKPTQLQIQENLKNVDEGKPLTISLAVLNGVFKKQYFRCLSCGKEIDGNRNLSGYCKSCGSKAYQKTDKSKAYKKTYYLKNKNRISKKE